MGDWKKHGGDFYNWWVPGRGPVFGGADAPPLPSNKFQAEASEKGAQSVEGRRAALERYLFHFKRYANHERSQQLEAGTRSRAEGVVKGLLEAGSGSWSDVAFVGAGTEEAIKCRGVLKWTYVLAFYLPEGHAEKPLFEYLQQELEQRTERLSALLEAEPAALLQPASRHAVLALVAACGAARRQLLQGVEERGLEAGGEAAGEAAA